MRDVYSSVVYVSAIIFSFFTGSPVSEAFATASFYLFAGLLCLAYHISVLIEKYLLKRTRF